MQNCLSTVWHHLDVHHTDHTFSLHCLATFNHFSLSVCDETQKSERDRFQIFFGTKFPSRLVPGLFWHQVLFDTGSEIFWYEIFLQKIPRLFLTPNFFQTGSNTIQKNAKVLLNDTKAQGNTKILRVMYVGGIQKEILFEKVKWESLETR